jgi:CheY-like chemotaxis protein
MASTKERLKTVLYVDDDKDDRELFLEVATEVNPKVKCSLANGAREAIQLLRTLSTQPDCIFIDINMPGISGIELLKILRANPHYSHTSMIILTTSREHVQQTILLGANNYFVKPNSYQHFYDLLKTCSVFDE